MYAFNICRVFFGDSRRCLRFQKKNAEDKFRAQFKPFPFGVKLLNIDRARFAAGWKRNFSLLRRLLYHEKRGLSRGFENFFDFSGKVIKAEQGYALYVTFSNSGESNQRTPLKGDDGILLSLSCLQLQESNQRKAAQGEGRSKTRFVFIRNQNSTYPNEY